MKKLAIIGAGPKAAAIAAKAHCLNQAGMPVEVEVFKKKAIGCHWDGSSGYTDGEQRLCTPAERDLGFPYTANFKPEVAADMQARFSWNAFLMEKKEAYLDWVNRGRLPPTHAEFTAYLEFAFRAANTVPIIGEVVSISRDRRGYCITRKDTVTGALHHHDRFDGIVFTGTGPPSGRLKRSGRDPDVLDGMTFWTQLAHVQALMTPGGKQVVIVGGGGTAAAISAWFARRAFESQRVVILNTQAVLFTRTANFFENRLFEDDNTWLGLSPESRKTFTERLNRGAVWEAVTDQLNSVNSLTLMPGRAESVTRTPRSIQPLDLTYKNATGPASLEADLVIDATGFNPWHFVDLLPLHLKTRLTDLKKRKTLALGMFADLSLPIRGHRLHVPAASEQIGPGYVSLMVLGGMADRILKPYVI